MYFPTHCLKKVRHLNKGNKKYFHAEQEAAERYVVNLEEETDFRKSHLQNSRRVMSIASVGDISPLPNSLHVIFETNEIKSSVALLALSYSSSVMP